MVVTEPICPSKAKQASYLPAPSFQIGHMCPICPPRQFQCLTTARHLGGMPAAPVPQPAGFSSALMAACLCELGKPETWQ